MHRFTLAFALFVFGCGGSTADTATTGGDDTGSVDGSTGETSSSESGGTDGAGDTASGGDTSAGPDTGASGSETGSGDGGGISCGKTTCAVGEVCCATPSSTGVGFMCSKTGCPDGGSTISCDSPDNCTTPGKGICCAEAEVTGSGFMCAFKAGTADCRASCTTMIPMSCPGKATVRPCKKAADCTEPGYANCCNFMGGGSSATFCAPDTIKAFATKCF